MMRLGTKGQKEKDEEEAEEIEQEETEDGGKGQLPVPPYTAADKAADGLLCFCEGCAYKTKSYGNLLCHVINFHGRKLTDLKGSYLYSQGMQENMKKQVDYRHRKKQTKTLAKSGAKPIVDIMKLKVATKQSAGCSQDPKRNEKDGKMENELVEVMDEEEPEGENADAKWLAIRCWMKCDLDGKPIEPYSYGGICHSTPQPGFTCKGRL